MRKTCAAARWAKAAALALAACCAQHAAAVNKCTLADGRVVYQDALCPASAGAGQVRLFTPPSDPAGRQRAVADVAAAAKLAKAAEVAPAAAVGLNHAPTAQAQDTLAALANACLDFYRPGLRDPASAYWSAAIVDKLDVLRMTLHAKNGFGGFVAKTVGCEVRNGQLDVDRTRTNADRLGM